MFNVSRRRNGGVGNVTRWATKASDEAVMDRDQAGREVMRLLQHYSLLPYPELAALADQPPIETEIAARGGLVSFTVYVRHASDDSLRVTVMAHGNNWWKMERLDESILVSKPIDNDG